jgi:hypothetical protein
VSTASRRPSPNLEYCRKQAKSLLKLARSNDPGAWSRIREHLSHHAPAEALTLADCQCVVARMNGEPSWPKLKKRIEAGAYSGHSDQSDLSDPSDDKTANAPAKPARGAAMSDAAVQAKTGRTWTEWCAVLDSKGAKQMSHKEIVALVKAEGIGSWWQQMVTVGYEQARGKRVINQSCEGDFQVSVSRTIAASIDRVYGAWLDEPIRGIWLPAEPIAIRKANLHKNIRIGWPSGGLVNAMFYEKPGGKCQCVADHTGLRDFEDVERMRAQWSEALDRLKALLEG